MNEQKPEPKIDGNHETLEVHSKWDTIQGEGPFAGEPASFIRLAGCNLQCPNCDTEYTQGRQSESVGMIVDWVKNQPRRNLVVITGGEPFRQANGLSTLVRGLLSWRRNVQIETNGTFPMFAMPRMVVVCSPKTPMLHNSATIVDAWKYVVSHGKVDIDGLPTSVLGMSKPPARPLNDNTVYVQPEDSKDPKINRLNLETAVESCLTFGYRLCLQVQKIVRLP